MKKPNLHMRTLFAAICTCILVALLTLIVYIQNTDMTYAALWEQRVAGMLPLPILILGNSVIIGGIVGYLAYSRILKKQISKLTDKLLQIERGNYNTSENLETYQEFDEILDKITVISSKLSKQAKQMQNAVNERENLRIEAISQERSRIARELHDSLSQQLFSIALTISALHETTDNAPIKQKLQSVEEMLTAAQSEVRVLLLNLRPIQLEGKSLTQGLRELLQELSAAQSVEIISHIDEVKLEQGVEDQMFRILQEAISNTLRHGEAKQIEVRLRRVETFVILKVIDDGIGFDVDKAGIGSYGLGTMNERAQEIGGTCKVLSLPGAGTTIEVRVPIEERGKHD